MIYSDFKELYVYVYPLVLLLITAIAYNIIFPDGWQGRMIGAGVVGIILGSFYIFRNKLGLGDLLFGILMAGFTDPFLLPNVYLVSSMTALVFIITEHFISNIAYNQIKSAFIPYLSAGYVVCLIPNTLLSSI